MFGSGLFEIVILAAVACFVLMQLYRTLGRTDGDEQPPPRNFGGPVKIDRPGGEAARNAEGRTSPWGQRGAIGADAFDGAARVMQADPDFDPERFLDGARAAYAAIVQAFDAHDRDGLADLVTPEVLASWSDAMIGEPAQRDGPLAVDIKDVRLVSGGAVGSSVQIKAAFDAEISEGADRREVKDLWTFTRDVRHSNPNWFLSSVEQLEN